MLVAVAWPYASGPRHIGHVSGFGVPSDIFARYQRLKGARVLMVSGTDEHGTPIQVQADAEKLKLDIVVRDLDFQSRKLRMDTELADHQTVALKADLDLRTKKEDWKKQANHEPDYPLEPFKDGVLTVSDRRIAMDGPIVSGVADYVTERIHYFNNKDEALPIFLVIDRSPGGSVMEGYRIVKAMQASKAPVHVIVNVWLAIRLP